MKRVSEWSLWALVVVIFLATSGAQAAVPDGCDNCPANANPNHEDFNGDGIGDACDGMLPANVPALRGWGLMALVILLLTSSFVMFERRRARPVRSLRN